MFFNKLPRQSPFTISLPIYVNNTNFNSQFNSIPTFCLFKYFIAHLGMNAAICYSVLKSASFLKWTGSPPVQYICPMAALLWAYCVIPLSCVSDPQCLFQFHSTLLHLKYKRILIRTLDQCQQTGLGNG